MAALRQQVMQQQQELREELEEQAADAATSEAAYFRSLVGLEAGAGAGSGAAPTSPMATLFGLETPLPPAQQQQRKQQQRQQQQQQQQQQHQQHRHAKHGEPVRQQEQHSNQQQQQQQQKRGQQHTRQQQHAQSPAAVQDAEAAEAAEEAHWEAPGSSDSELFDVPSLAELLDKAGKAWFGGDSDDDDGATTQQAQQQQRPRRPGGPGSLRQHSSRLLPSWMRPPQLRVPALLQRNASWAAKPLHLKVAEQMLSKPIVNAIDTINDEVIEAKEPLGPALIKFLLRALDSVITNWANSNLDRVFAAFGLYVAATCGLFHGTKVAAKRLAWRLPGRLAKVAGPAVGFAADVLLPTPFFGPFLATFVLTKVVIKKRAAAKARAKEAAAAAAAAEAAAANGDAGGSDAGSGGDGGGGCGDRRPRKQQSAPARQHVRHGTFARRGGGGRSFVRSAGLVRGASQRVRTSGSSLRAAGGGGR